MTIIVEDGTGLDNAESLISVDYFTTHHTNRGNTNVSLLSTQESEEALRRASDYFLQTYRDMWQGYLLNTEQALDWPRQDVIVTDGYRDYAIEAGVIPERIKMAVADLAFKAASGELLADIEQQETMVKVGPIEVQYDKSSPRKKRYSAIDALLKPYFKCSTSGINTGLVRS